MRTSRKIFGLSVTFAIIYFILLFSQIAINSSKGKVVVTGILDFLFLSFLISTTAAIILKYKEKHDKSVIIFLLGYFSWCIGQIFLQAYLEGYITYSMFYFAYIIYIVSLCLFLLSLISYIKSKKYIKIMMNSIIEIFSISLNTMFVVWYIACSYIVYRKRLPSSYQICRLNYAYYTFYIFIIFAIYFMIEKFYNEDYFKEINNYKNFLNKKIWYAFIISTILVWITAIWDFYMASILRWNKVLEMNLYIATLVIVVRELFNFFAYKNIVDDFEKRMKYTDILLDYNVNISKDLKKSFEKSKQEIELAKKIQQALIPEKATILADTFTINSKLITSMDMCGDYYDYFSNGDTVIWVVADVMGKGMKAAMLGSNLRMLLKMLLQRPQSKEELDPSRLLEQVNMFMFDDLDKIGAYITMVVGMFDIKENILKVSSAGHVPPIYISDGKVNTINIKATAIGLKRASAYTTKTVKLNSGDSVIFYTDGAWDVRDVKSNRLGSKEFLSYIENNKEKSFDLLNLIEKKLNEFRGRNEFSDDVTISVLNMV